jgi:tetratricopeptide (TPR) repeat protein
MAGNKRAYDGAMKKASTAAWDRKWPGAIREYQRALSEFPQDTTAHSGLALALEESGRFDEALNEYQLTRNLLPHDPEPLEKTAALHQKLGHVEKAADDLVALGDIFASTKHVTRAVEAWKRAAVLTPMRIDVHEKLFAAYKEAGNDRSGAQELIALAQARLAEGDSTRAQILIQQALTLDPQNSQARGMKAEILGRPPSPEREAKDSPVEKARRSSLSRLAQTVFEEGPGWRRSAPSLPVAASVDVERLLAAAIDAQTHGRTGDAIDRYEQILRAGRAGPEIQFNLALLYKDTLRYDDAIALLQRTSGEPQFAPASYFAIGECCRAQGKIDVAMENFLQAMKVFDLATVDREQADQVIRLYESLAEGYREKGAQSNAEKSVQSLVDFLSGRGWEDKVREVRRHLESLDQSGTPVSFAEVLELPNADRVIESLGLIEEYLREGHLTAATDESMRSIELAPDYLPAHQRLAEILAKSGRKQEAREKYEKLAETALVRGDTPRALAFYRQAISLAPQDTDQRAKLIDLLISHGQLPEAWNEYLQLGEFLDRAGDSRKAIDKYTEGIRLAQQAGAVSPAVLELRDRLADAYMKAHDWQNALGAFQEILARTPADERARFYLTELYFRLGHQEDGERELNDLLSLNVSAPKKTRTMLAALSRTLPNNVPLNLRLARAYVDAGQNEKAVEGLDALGERLLNAGEREAAIQVIREIVSLNPPRVDDYRKVLEDLLAAA